MNNDTPLIWTTRGNVPADSLKYEQSWIDAVDFVKFTETFSDPATGEVLRQNVHVMSRRGVFAEGQQAAL